MKLDLKTWIAGPALVVFCLACTGCSLIGSTVPIPEDAPVLELIDFKGKRVSHPRAAIESVERNDAPQISIHVPRFEGDISAMYEDIPVRLLEIEGQFTLSENANV